MEMEKKKGGQKLGRKKEEDKDRFRLQHPGDLSPTLHITMQKFKIG